MSHNRARDGLKISFSHPRELFLSSAQVALSLYYYSYLQRFQNIKWIASKVSFPSSVYREIFRIAYTNKLEATTCRTRYYCISDKGDRKGNHTRSRPTFVARGSRKGVSNHYNHSSILSTIARTSIISLALGVEGISRNVLFFQRERNLTICNKTRNIIQW